MASSLTPSIKSSLGSSKSAFLQHGFSLQSVTFPRFFMKACSFGVFARAAMEKTLYDFTIKVIFLADLYGLLFVYCLCLIVNVASRCGVTTGNCSELSHVYEKYKT
ncbi:hypothetical protein Pint_21100 [Pistacia integerrima]|uniref:Uncharacterized protein n=1 Tax=Pistacia integerrima TaxID=434235 RepID=A0ACC0X8C7_9ROSI|nr:hypothetical protein Pint_21100 [Pistacia integerrima]